MGADNHLRIWCTAEVQGTTEDGAQVCTAKVHDAHHGPGWTLSFVLRGDDRIENRASVPHPRARVEVEVPATVRVVT